MVEISVICHVMLSGAFNSIRFRILRAIGREGASRPDLLSFRDLNHWRRSLSGCTVGPDLEIRGRKNPLDCLHIGEGVAIDRSCIFWLADEVGAQPRLDLGERVYIGPFSFLGSFHPITIGRDTIIGAYSYLISGNHGSLRCEVPFRDQGYEGAPIQIGVNVWLGCHVVVLPGVTIGDHAIVGAGSVVTRNIPSGETWGGVPARPLRMDGT
jgi:acetyltransferase-like isoleucine patch superfamily enzyme